MNGVRTASVGTVGGVISGKCPNEMDQAANGAAGQLCLTFSFIICFVLVRRVYTLLALGLVFSCILGAWRV